MTQAFAPFNASGAIRVGKLAQYLLERGHDVRVLTASPLPYPRTLPVEIPADRISRTMSLDPFALLAWLRRNGPKGGAPAPAGSLLGTGYSGRLRRELGALLAIPEPQAGWYVPAVARGRQMFRAWRPHAVYASALPFTAHMVAARLARDATAPWIAEFRDQFSGNPYSNLPRWRGGIDRRIEKRVLATASACVTVSEPIAEALRRQHGKPTLVVLNGYDVRAEAQAQPSTDRLAPVRVVYTGVIYPGRRDPSALFAALASLGDLASRVDVVFYGQDLRSVREAARRFGVEERVRVQGAIAYADSLAEQQRADLLLLLLWSDPREVGVYTGKLFEYVGAGRPILAVGSEAGVAADLIRSRGLGVVATAPDAIASALRQWIEEKSATGRIAGPSPQAKVGLSREEQFSAVDELLSAVVNPAIAPAMLPGVVAQIQSRRA